MPPKWTITLDIPGEGIKQIEVCAANAEAAEKRVIEDLRQYIIEIGH
jgi:hypothetical protein